MLTFNYPMSSTGLMTGTTTVNSDSQEMTNMLYMSIQVVWIGTPTGTFSVQHCNDAQITSTSVWTPLSSSAVTLNGTQPAGGSGGNLSLNNNATGVPWPWVRLSYTNASGTGAFTARINAKGA